MVVQLDDGIRIMALCWLDMHSGTLAAWNSLCRRAGSILIDRYVFLSPSAHPHPRLIGVFIYCRPLYLHLLYLFGCASCAGVSSPLPFKFLSPHSWHFSRNSSFSILNSACISTAVHSLPFTSSIIALHSLVISHVTVQIHSYAHPLVSLTFPPSRLC